jgi:hypothetical protein
MPKFLLAVHCWFVSGVIPLLPNCICCPAEETGFAAAILVTSFLAWKEFILFSFETFG